MKVTVKVLKEVKFIIDLVSEDGVLLGHIPLTPDVKVSAKYYEESLDKWIEGRLELREDIIWFVRRVDKLELTEGVVDCEISWPVDERLLEDTNLYSLWNPDWGVEKEKSSGS